MTSVKRNDTWGSHFQLTLNFFGCGYFFGNVWGFFTCALLHTNPHLWCPCSPHQSLSWVIHKQILQLNVRGVLLFQNPEKGCKVVYYPMGFASLQKFGQRLLKTIKSLLEVWNEVVRNVHCGLCIFWEFVNTGQWHFYQIHQMLQVFRHFG